MAKKSRNEARLKRHRRVRKKISGTTDKPRLNVYRSHMEIYAQVVDDEKMHTLAAASSIDHELRGQLEGKTKTEKAALVGELVAKRAKETGVKVVVFDRGGYIYGGRVKALAEAARKAGLEF